MKNFLSKIKNIFKKSPKKIAIDTSINPHRHWRVLLWLFLVIIVIFIVFSFYLLLEIKNDQIFQVTPGTKEDTGSINQDLLYKITTSFKEKAQKESTIKLNPTSYQDPSL